MKEFGAEIDKAARADRLDRVAMAATGAGLAIGAAFAGIVRSAANFDKAMDEVNAVTDVTVDVMGQLERAAIEAGQATQYSATQAAKAEAELARAGLSAADILGGGLRGALALASAGQIDLEESAIVTAKALNTFGLDGGQAGHVADVLAASANKSATNVHEMGLATKQAGLLASQAGMSFEETAGALALFAQNGLAGSDGGTSLKTALMMLFSPTKKSADLMKDLGIEVFTAQGEFIGLDNVADVLQQRLSGLSDEARGAAIAQIFGADASRAANVLYKEGGDRVREFTDAVNDQGAAQRTASQLTDNLAGDWERFTGALETFAIESGGGANQGLRGLTQGATALLNVVADLPPALTSTVVVAAGLTAGALLLFAGFTKASIATARLNTQLAAMGPLGAKAAGALSTVGRTATRAAGAFLAIEAAGALVRAVTGDINTESAEFTKTLVEWGKSGQLAGASLDVLGKDLENLTNLKILADLDNSRRSWTRGLQDFGEGIPLIGDALAGADGSLTKTREIMSGLDKQLTDLVSAGKAGEAKAVFDQLMKSLEGTGVDVSELMTLLPGYNEALKNTAAQSAKLASNERKAAAGALLLSANLGEAAYEGKSLIEIFETLNNQAITFAQAQISAEAALDGVTESLKEHGKTLKVDSEEGRANLGTILDSITASAELAQKKYEETGSLGEATKVYDQYIGRLRQALIDMGLNSAEVDKLLGQYAQMPDFKTVKIITDAQAAKAELDATIAKVLQLKDKSIRISANVFWTQSGDLHVPGGTILRRDGGVREDGVTYAAAGTLREAAMYSAQGSRPRYGYAEPQTGGEMFLPKNGNQQRGERHLAIGAGWYGGTYVPAGGGGGQAATINNTLTVNTQRSDLTVGALEAFQRRIDARQRVGRPY